MAKVAWMRELTVTFTSNILKRAMTFGNSTTSDNLKIDVVCHKYMSTLKDDCTIKISNLTYGEIVQLISGQYYTVEVKAGYKSSGAQTIFKGGVLYISNSLDDNKTNTVIVLCASELVAKYGQQRINLSLNSGINLYSALQFVCKRAGITNSNISTQFKKQFLNEIVNVNSTIGGWIDKLAAANPSYITNSDSITGSSLMIFDANKSDARKIRLTANTINLSGGYPRLTSDGLSLTLMPTFAFMCGDVIELDNSIIDISASSRQESYSNYGYYLDKDGMYVIYQQEYNLSNRSSEFTLALTCKSRSLMNVVSGG